MDEPAQTVQYFIAGYTVIFIGLIGYVVSMYFVGRNCLREENA